MDKIKCFMIEPNGEVKIYARRYASTSSEDKCPIHGYHDCRALTQVIKAIYDDGGYLEVPTPIDLNDTRWPAKCDCGYVFKETDAKQTFQEMLYRRVDNPSDVFTLKDAPVGAMWYLDTTYKDVLGPDNKSLVVRTPGGDWWIDSRARNCTLPNDHIHKCWVRHGVPPNVTVDKNGVTCGAGAGSIAQPGYHGFLLDGYLVQC